MNLHNRLRLIDRAPAVSRLASIVFAVVMVYAHGLLQPQPLVTLAMFMATKSGISPPVYSLVHHRPMEVCDTYDTDKTASIVALTTRRDASAGVSAVAAALREVNAQARAVWSAPCRGRWVWQPGSGTGNLYAQFGRDAWQAWLYERFGMTEAWAAAFVVAGLLLGAFGLGRLAFFLTGSNLLSALALLGVAGIDRWITPMFALPIVVAWYGFSTAWLIAVFAREERRPWAAWVVLVSAMAINLLGYLIVAHSAAFLSVTVPLLLCGLAVASRPSRAKWIAFAAVAVIAASGLYDCSRFATRQLAGVSVMNFASSGSFGDFALTTGFWTERPNPWSYPLGDFGVSAASLAEPMIFGSAPLTFEYQGFALVGRQLLIAMLVRHPLIYLENLWKRPALLVWKLPTIARPTYDLAPRAVHAVMALAVVALLVGAGALFRREAWLLELPIAGLALWNFFGLEVLTHVVHTHTNYFMPGFLQLLLVAPLLLIILAGQLTRAVRRCRQMDVGTRKRASIAALVASLVLGAYGTRALRRELSTFDIWYQPWLGVYTEHPEKGALMPDTVARRIERLRQLGEPAPGSISMYAAWTQWRLAWNVWRSPAMVGDRLGMTPADVEEQRKRAESLAVLSFRRALTEAPDDAWIPTFATVIDPESSVKLYTRLLEHDRDSLFAPHFAKHLYNTVPGGQKYGDLFEQLTHDRLVSSAAIRPGFAELPPVASIAQGTSDVAKSQLYVVLQPGGTIIVGAAPGYATDRLKLFVYARVEKGSASANLQLQAGAAVVSGTSQPLSSTDGSRYRFFDWVGAPLVDTIAIKFTAGPAGAELRVRDFYPLIENPHRDAW